MLEFATRAPGDRQGVDGGKSITMKE